MAENTPLNEEKKGSGKKIIIIISIVLLIGLNAFQAWWKYDTDQKNLATIEEKDNSIAEQKAEIEAMLEQIEVLKEEKLKLGLDITELERIQEDLKIELKKMTSWANSLNGQVKRRDKKIKSYEELLRNQDAELQQKREEIAALNAENTVLKEAVVERNDTISNLQTQKNDLQETVAQARILRASEFNVIGVNAKGKQKDDDVYKAKWLDMIKVEFSLDPNKVAISNSKEVYLVVKNTSGTTIYDETSGGGTFEFEGNEIYYSVKQDVQYVREGVRAEFTFKNPNLYEEGTQKIEIYCEGALIGTSTFDIK